MPPRRRRFGAGVYVGASVIAVAVVATVTIALRLGPHPTLASRVASSTAITAADGTLLRLTLAEDGQYRLWTPLDHISPLLVEATLLYEDRQFFRHPGVNPFALGRAAARTYLGGDRRVGGSTLTMQLARRLWGVSSRTVSGKLVQIARALQLEAQYSKRDILEAYLNVAPYGGNIEGAGAASAIYFRRPAAALTLAEALTLAVIPQSPTRRGGAAQRGGEDEGAVGLERARNGLLARWTARDGAPAAKGNPTSFAWPRLRRPDDLPFAAPHFVDRVMSEPQPATPHGTTASERRTTLDPRLQRLLERHVRAYVARQHRKGIDNAAALLVDARVPAVRALVGSANFFDPRINGQVNGTRARRSPGSTLKPFAYALGLDQGVIHPATMLRDVPTAFAAYSPENFDGRFAGPLSAKEALIRSRNVPAMTVAGRLARPTLYGLLRSAGVDLPFPEDHYGLGLVLGTGEVTMEELVSLYAALANRGVARPLLWRLDDERARATATAANPLAARDTPSDGVRLFSEESAFLIRDMLSDNPRPTTRLAAAAETLPVDVAWKTGTSWGFRDAWAVGLFGPYVLAIWVGDFSGAGNPAFVGAEAAAPLFFQIVDSIAAQHPVPGVDLYTHRATAPRTVRRVEVCAVSGGLPTAHCPHRRSSWFIAGRSPIEPCAIHRTVALDAEGRRTCALGPPTVRTEVFEVWPSDLAKLFSTAGLPRRPLPSAAPGCDEVESPRGAAPRITSPLAGVTYTLRPSRGERAAGDTVALQAVTDGDASGVYWFADQAFLGRSARGSTLFWQPGHPGSFMVRAVDDLGRADARAVAIEAQP